jgi:hypothetical protein
VIQHKLVEPGLCYDSQLNDMKGVDWNMNCISLGYETSLTCKAPSYPLPHYVQFLVSALVCVFHWYAHLRG